MQKDSSTPETEYLYHYQRFDTKDRRRWLIDTLTKHQIHCSNPLHFNDPWDGKPNVRPDDFDDPKRAEQIARYFERVANPPLQPHERVPRDPGFLKMLIERANPELAKAIGRIFRVYCLSPFPELSLMWSHYAQGHTGICLQFSRRNNVFATAQKVIYTEKLPSYSIDDNEDRARTMLQTKSNEWEYEQEYRLIARAGEVAESAQHPALLVTRKNYLTIEKNWLVSVIAGCRAPFDEIQALVSKHSPGLLVRRAVKASDSYRVVIENN